MTLKALQSAIALLLLAGPIGATQAAESGEGVVLQERALTQDLAEQEPADRHSPDETTDAAADKISAPLKAKIRAIIAFLSEEAGNPSPDGTELLRSRVRVHCSVRHVMAKPKTKPSLNAAPAALLGRDAREPKAASATLEACTIKLLQVRASRPSQPAKREFSIELPQPGESTP
jgi:hypothetical protein